ncbi:hypothetical protein HY994_00545 [Candidatus Micrarchaeota archaeon]|nr:hypothetical protein [Candidatus Micrarchaeota archaeon]
MKSEKLDAHAIGSASAAIFGFWFILCAAALYLFQSPTMMLGQNMFHGVSLQPAVFSIAGVLLGLVAWLVLSYASGYGFANLYNRWAK